MDEKNTSPEQLQSETMPTKDRSDRFLPISILIAAVLIGGSVVFATVYKTNLPAPTQIGNTGGIPSDPNAGGAPAPTPVANATAVMTLGSRDAVLGSANAPVTIIEYGDYQCPFCAQFFSQTESQIVANYVNTGKVKMVFRNFAFLGAESTAAAEAAECAEDQNKLWAYHDALYSGKVADENKGGGEDDGFYNRALFLKLAGQVGLNIPTFTQCIDSNKYATVVAQEKTTAGSTASVNSTPTFFLNGQQILGAEPYTTFKAEIDALLKA